MNFMRGQMLDGLSFKLINVIGNFNREMLGIEIDFSLPSERVIKALKQIIGWRSKPLLIRCDNDPENIISLIQTWAQQSGISFQYIQTSKTQQK